MASCEPSPAVAALTVRPDKASELSLIDAAYHQAKALLLWLRGLDGPVDSPAGVSARLAVFQFAIRDFNALEHSLANPVVLDAVRAANRGEPVGDWPSHIEKVAHRARSYVDLVYLAARGRSNHPGQVDLTEEELVKHWDFVRDGSNLYERGLDVHLECERWRASQCIKGQSQFSVQKPDQDCTTLLFDGLEVVHAKSGTWAFGHGEYVYRGRRVKLPGKQMKLLRQLVAARFAVPFIYLVNAGWEGDDLAPVAKTVSRLRKHLREEWTLDNDPITSRGGGAYCFEHSAFGRQDNVHAMSTDCHTPCV